MFVRLFNGLIDTFYPKRCLSCKSKIHKLAVDNFICAECWAKIKKNRPPFCHSCGRQLEKKGFAKNICSGCIRKMLHFDRAFSPCTYTGIIKELIHDFKYNQKDYLGLPLSKLMIEFIKEYSLPMDKIDFIIPMPLHKTRLREREFNQAEILSRHIGNEFKVDVLATCLERSRYTKTQTELSPHERFLNVENCFSVNGNRNLKRKNILLVDDVLTTAATSSEASRALKNAGSGIVFVLTLAN
ncbi:MAG: ComF family protein [Candidatus Omnitrophica bacterium]|nr:ComF family protein [Candidatus Omnitrophota bacterium]